MFASSCDLDARATVALPGLRHMGSPVDPQTTTSPSIDRTPVHLPTQHGLSGDVNLLETNMLLLRSNTLRLSGKLLSSSM